MRLGVLFQGHHKITMVSITSPTTGGTLSIYPFIVYKRIALSEIYEHPRLNTIFSKEVGINLPKGSYLNCGQEFGRNLSDGFIVVLLRNFNKCK